MFLTLTEVKMRRTGIVIGVVLIISLCSCALAGPVGNPAKPALEIGDTPFKVGVEMDLVTERDLDISDKSVGIDRIKWYGAKLSYNFEDIAETSIALCAADLKFTEKYIQYETETGFGLGLGQSFVLYEFDNGLRVGLDGKIRFIDADVDNLFLGGTRYLLTDSGVQDVKVEYQEWQLAAGISKELEGLFGFEYYLPEDWIFVPYAGVKYSDVRVTGKAYVSGTSYNNEDINSDNIFGVFLGCDVLATEDLSVGLEARFIDEQGFTFSVNYRF